MTPPIKKFTGFVPPEKNFFQMPNEWIDICAEIRDISELKVIQYILRHTWGFHEYGICKTISVDEFMQGRRRQDGSRMDKGTGLSEQSVRNGIKQAIEDGYLVCETDTSDAGRIKKSYTLKMVELEVQTLYPPQTLDPLNSRPQGTNPYTSDSQSLDPRVPEFRPRSEKDTIERHYKKDTEERQEREEVATATARSQTSSQNDLSEETVKREAVKASQKEVAHVQNQTHSGNSGNSSQPHLDTNAHSRPLDASLGSQPTKDTVKKEVVHGHVDKHPVVDRDLPAHGDQPVPRSDSKRDTNTITQPPAPRKPPANPTIPKRPRPQQQELTDELPATAHSKPVEPLAEMAWGTRKCLQWFDYWRGGTLIAKYKLQQAASCAKGLAEQFDEKTVVDVYGDMAADQYYIERGGPDVCDVANNIHKYINKKKPKKEPSNEHKSNFYTLDAFIERQNQWKTETEGVTS